VNDLPNISNPFSSGNEQNRPSAEQLWQYVQNLSPDAIAQGFDISITTSREDLGRLLASAMMSGYFIRNVEQRMAFETAFSEE
jgi:Protein of unknown function (DUF760)